MRIAALLLLAVFAGAQERPQTAQDFADSRLKVWQGRMNLGNWKVSVTFIPARDLRPKTVGRAEIEYPSRTAVIRVLWPSTEAMVESVIVHELVHLSLTPTLDTLRGDESIDREEERAVRHITEALLAAQDGACKEKGPVQ
ncbi:MAG: hypothetical protein ABSC23_03880 [Bryobacteraceae bacterium]|jgi:hypothetical protein